MVTDLDEHIGLRLGRVECQPTAMFDAVAERQGRPQGGRIAQTRDHLVDLDDRFWQRAGAECRARVPTSPTERDG